MKFEEPKALHRRETYSRPILQYLLLPPQPGQSFWMLIIIVLDVANLLHIPLWPAQALSTSKVAPQNYSMPLASLIPSKTSGVGCALT